MLGSQPVYRTQAERIVRTAIILKGEGMRTFFPFYGIDYNRDEGWGFCFNLEVDGNPWGTHRISPKPAVNALAACARVLEGTTPRGRLHIGGKDVWAYAFTRNGTTITALWTPRSARTVAIPPAVMHPLRILDILGHPIKVATKRGLLMLNISQSPIYVLSQ
jgi:hypothetical protein